MLAVVVEQVPARSLVRSRRRLSRSEESVREAAETAPPPLPLEVEPELSRHGARSDIVRAAEGGKKVVERILVSDINCGQCETPFVALAFEQVVITEGNIEQATMRDARWIMVVIFTSPARALI